MNIFFRNIRQKAHITVIGSVAGLTKRAIVFKVSLIEMVGIRPFYFCTSFSRRATFLAYTSNPIMSFYPYVNRFVASLVSFPCRMSRTRVFRNKLGTMFLTVKRIARTFKSALLTKLRCIINSYPTITANRSLPISGIYIYQYTLIAILFIICFIPNQAAAIWFDSSWDYRVKIEVNPAKVGTTSAVTSFPIYLDLAGMPNDFWTNASSTGADIRITESDGSTETAFELVSFSTTTKRGELHFLADSLSTTSTSTFYIYYGNPSAAAYAVTDTYGRNNVWTIYAGVWHMENNPNDSTSNGYNFTELNSPTYTEEGIGRSVDFGSANTNKGLRIINTLLGFSSATQDWTKTVTVKVETQPTTGQVQQFFNRMYGETVGTQIRFYYINNSGTNRIVVQNDGGGVVINHAVTLTTNEYTRVAATKVGSILTLYVNGVPIATGTSTGTVNYSSYTDEMTIGLERTGVGSAFKGHQDEARLARTGFSTAFILTEYNNQSSTSTFFYIGPQETDAATSTQVYPTDTVIMFD